MTSTAPHAFAGPICPRCLGSGFSAKGSPEHPVTCRRCEGSGQHFLTRAERLVLLMGPAEMEAAREAAKRPPACSNRLYEKLGRREREYELSDFDRTQERAKRERLMLGNSFATT